MGRRHSAMHRMPPTDQCLDPDPRAAHEVMLRLKAVAAVSTQSNSSPAQIQFLFSDANADMWTAGFVSIRMTNLDDVRLRTA